MAESGDQSSRETDVAAGLRITGWPAKALGWAAVAGLVALVSYIASPIARVLLLAFAGILVAIFLDGLARAVAAHTKLGRGASLVVVLLALVAISVAGALVLVPRVVPEVRKLASALPPAVSGWRDAIEHSAWGRELLGWLPSSEQLGARSSEIAATAGKFIGGVFSAIGGLALIAFVGIAGAASPGPYAEGLIRLAPRHRRDRWREVFGAVREKLFLWVVGRLVNMTLIGVITSIGLAIIGIPAPIGLGALAGLLTFIPNLGPLISVVPAALLAIAQGPTALLWVLALYAGAQTLESYVVTPLIQRRATSVPPALLLTAQIALGMPLGALGLLLATPLVATAIVLVRAFYVEDRLGDRDRSAGGEPAHATTHPEAEPAPAT